MRKGTISRRRDLRAPPIVRPVNRIMTSQLIQNGKLKP